MTEQHHQDRERRHALTEQVTSINMVAISVAAMVGWVLLVAVEFLTLRQGLISDLEVQSQIIGDNEIAPLVFGDGVMASKVLGTLDASPTIVVASVLAEGGAELARYHRPGAEGPLATAHGQPGILPRLVEIERAIEFEGQRIGTLQLWATLDPLYRRLLGYAGTTLVIMLGSILTAFQLVVRMRRNVRDAEQRLDFLAHTDPITGLPNRHAVNERLRHAVERARQGEEGLTLLMIDLDNFKLVNDSFGHHMGDALLVEVARRLRDELRESDFVGRLGGDEFAVVLDGGGSVQAASRVADKLLSAFKEPFLVGVQDVFVSISIGASFCPLDADEVDDLVRNADTAMYAAKAAGRGTYRRFVTGMSEHTRERLSLEAGLRRAIKRGEFVLHYQPQVDIASGRVVGVEALVRWISPEQGMVPPDHFIPLAEETGLILPIGTWVLRTACAQAMVWRGMGGPPLTMAVNLSVLQLEHEGIEATVREVLADTGLPAEWLELEITESALMKRASANAEVLARLSAHGIRVSVDDFGTGYSSMSYLKRFPINKLKIDRGFVTDLVTSRDDQAIVSAMIAMSHSLGIQVIAEGVETREQYDRLALLRCDMAQGYLISRPLPAEALQRFLVEHGTTASRLGQGGPNANKGVSP